MKSKTVFRGVLRGRPIFSARGWAPTTAVYDNVLLITNKQFFERLPKRLHRDQFPTSFSERGDHRINVLFIIYFNS